MLYQLHHQSKEDTTVTEMVAQEESEEGTWWNEKVREWWKSIAEKYPLPEGFQWLMCNEKSEYFTNAVFT